MILTGVLRSFSPYFFLIFVDLRFLTLKIFFCQFFSNFYNEHIPPFIILIYYIIILILLLY